MWLWSVIDNLVVAVLRYGSTNAATNYGNCRYVVKQSKIQKLCSEKGVDKYMREKLFSQGDTAVVAVVFTAA